jgi:DNA-binding MarR family transcriptional regulator
MKPSGPTQAAGPPVAAGGDVVERIELASAVLVRHFEMLRRRSDVYHRLERAEYLLLHTLDLNRATDICGLAGHLGLDPSTAGRQVNVLAGRGLVRRAADPEDRRRSVVTLTDDGRRLMEEVRRRRRQATQDLLADWSDEDRRVLADVFERYNETVARRYLS